MTALQPTIDSAAPADVGSDRAQAIRVPDQATPAVSPKTWLAVFGATLGAFMAVLNIQIVNASLADIQGAIGAGIDDGGWISTSYLIAEIVVIPLSGWLAQVFSVRIYLLTNAVLFLVFSAACALAQDLPQMIVLRAVQGFCGGVLIPMAFTLIITLLPKAKQSIGLAMFAVSATFAPAIGPTIGGYLTENWGWQYIFYVNLVPGALMIGMLWFSLDAKPMKLSLLRQGDWPGVITMAIGLSALQTVLEEGNKDDWFGSAFIVRLSIIAVVALAPGGGIVMAAEKGDAAMAALDQVFRGEAAAALVVQRQQIPMHDVGGLTIRFAVEQQQRRVRADRRQHPRRLAALGGRQDDAAGAVFDQGTEHGLFAFDRFAGAAEQGDEAGLT